MSSFISKRFKITEPGTKGCRHDWNGDRCASCEAVRRELPGWTCYWTTIDPTILGSVLDGTFRRDTKLTVADLLDRWLAAKRSEGLKEGTLTMYSNVVNGWLKPNIGGLPVTQLNETVAGELDKTLRSPEGSRLGRGALSDRSVQLAITVLKAATKWAWSQSHLMAHDVLAGYKRPKDRAGNRASSAWSAEEARQFLASVADDRLRCLWWLLLTRAPRRGEACGLKWEDVKLDLGRLQIVHTRVMVGASAGESDPKTAAGVRPIKLDAQLVTEFHNHRRRQLEERMAAGPAWEDSGYVFVDELGAPVLPQTVSRRFDALIAKAGVRRIRLHDARHSAATLLLEDGVPVHIVSKMLGHSKPSITLDIYSHAVDTGGDIAGERLTALLSAQAGGEEA